MSTVGSYPVSNFSPTQYFLVYNPSSQTLERVLGSELVTAINGGAVYVRAVSTRAVAQTKDYDVDTYVLVGGDTAVGDNFAAVYLVVEGGTGDFPMLNGNDLLVIRGDQFLREQLISEDAGEGASLVSMEGGPTVEEAVNDRVVRIDSVAEGISGLSGISGKSYRANGFHDGSNFGGQHLIFNGATAKSQHGITGWSPTVPAVSLQAGATLADRTLNYINGVGETDPGGSGLFEIQEKFYDVYQYGELSDGSNAADIADYLISVINANGSTGSSGKETTGAVIYYRDGVHDLTSGLTNSIDVDNTLIVGQSPDGTIIKVASNEVFKWGEGLMAGRAHGGGVYQLKFYSDLGAADNTNICISLYKTAHMRFERIRLRDVGGFAKLGDASATDVTSSAHFADIMGWVANVGKPTFDLQEGAGFRLSDSYIFTNIPAPTQVSGTHDGAGGAAVLSDSGADFGAVDSLIGGVVFNVSDGSIGTITANTSSTVTAALSGGSGNDWDNGDVYVVQEPHQAMEGQDFIRGEGNWDTVNLTNVNCNRYSRPVNCNPASGKNCSNWFYVNFFGDYNARGVRLYSDGANIRNHRYTNVWSFSTDGDSFELNGTATGLLEDIVYEKCQAKLSGRNGFSIEKGKYVTIDGGVTQGQGRLGTGYGVYIDGGDNVRVIGGTHGLDASSVSPFDAQADYGVRVTSSAKRYRIIDVTADGGVDGYLIDKASVQPAANQIKGNKKTDGSEANYVSSGNIIVPASTVNYTNDSAFEKEYTMHGGAVTNVQKNGVRISTGTNVTFRLLPDETFNVTYSAVPVVTEAVVN